MKRLTLLFIFVALIGCEVEDGRGINCGKEFHVLSVEVVDQTYGKILLDRFSVTDVQTNEDLSINGGLPTPIDQIMGIYPVVDDSRKNEFRKKSLVKVLFKGYIGEEEVCSREFSIGNDGCHVYIAKGDTELVVTR